jgi:hypothetical protein
MTPRHIDALGSICLSISKARGKGHHVMLAGWLRARQRPSYPGIK